MRAAAGGGKQHQRRVGYPGGAALENYPLASAWKTWSSRAEAACNWNKIERVKS